MPKEVIPITGLDQVGVIADSPPVSLPPNAFSDVRNVRFKDGAVRKMEGEVNIFPNLFDSTDGTMSFDGSTLKYVVWWPNPHIIDENRGYYLVITEVADFARPNTNTSLGRRDVAYLVEPGSTTRVYKGDFSPDDNANWQHTFFQGGFALIINNGLDAPHYILDTNVDADSSGTADINDISNFAVLPGWESYNVNAVTIDDTFNESTDTRTFTLGNPVDFTNYRILVNLRTPAGLQGSLTFETADTVDNEARYEVVDGLARLVLSPLQVPDGTQVTIRVTSRMPVNVTAGVIRSFGDFLVAGNLVERLPIQANQDAPTVLRNLAGVVRTSDAAAPGEVPTNWNPFAAGVSTADEFVLTATGVVQDMVELQGNFYIYSNSSISIMRQTNNPQVPLNVAPLTDSYGAQTTSVVQEYDGKHFVIGTQDLYVFGGHPGSIQSVADQRVRRFFFDNLNPLHNQRMFTLRYSQRDEIWVCYPTTASVRGECDQALVWNYRQNNWTIRDLSSVVAGDVGPVPGGGLPTSTNAFDGVPGSNEVIQTGIRELQGIQFPTTLNPSIQSIHGGVPSVYNIEVQGLQAFTSIAASFNIAVTDQFDSGPNYGGDLINFQTPAVDLRTQLLMSNDSRADVTVALPRYLTSDKPWDIARTYLAGNGRIGEVGYYPGQRVIAPNALDVPTVYRVLNGFGDGSVPATFYDPNEQGPFYTTEQNLIYQDTQDIVGVMPRDLVFNAPYGTIPGDGGTGNAITASQARWEDLGPASTNTQTVADVVNIIQQTLRADPTFIEFFNTTPAIEDTSSLIIESRASSGSGTFPTFRGVSIEFGFPDINPAATDETNGGNIGLAALTISPAASSVSGDAAVMFQSSTSERQYIPFDPTNIAGTGRYASDPSAAVLDRVAITFNGTFTGPTLNQEVAAVIRDGFRRDPTEFWATTGENENIIITSLSNGNFSLDITVPPETDQITPANFAVTTMTRGQRPTNSDAGNITPEPAVFMLTPPPGDTGESVAYVSPATQISTISDRGDLLFALALASWGTVLNAPYPNWEIFERDEINGDRIVIRTAAAPEGSTLPPSLRQAERPANGVWTVNLVAPGNSINVGLDNPAQTSATSVQVTEGRFAVSTTPTYMGILVSNPAIPTSRLEFLLLESRSPTQRTAAQVTEKWVAQIRAAIPRISVQQRGNGFFLQPANYDDLANFVLDVRINDTPANANWIYEIVTNGTNPETMATGIAINSASDTPLFINGGEAGHVFDPDAIPVPTAGEYVRSGGPLKIQQVRTANSSIPATFRNTASTTLVFDIFRPWPRDEINQNLEFPIFATVVLDQDEQGIFRNLNKVTGADIGWSKPSYLRVARATTADTATFTEMVNMGTDDFPRDYESYVERVQLAIQPEFDTEQLSSLALWADGSTPEFLRGNIMHNQLDVRVVTTNNPGEITSLATRPSTTGPNGVSNLFNVSTDYKIDMRQHGRFMNYRITDGFTLDTTADNNPTHQAEWRLSGMQADVMKGGTR